MEESTALKLRTLKYFFLENPLLRTCPCARDEVSRVSKALRQNLESVARHTIS